MMALNNYALARVKLLFSKDDKDILGNSVVLALCEGFYEARMRICSVSKGIVDVIKEKDLVLIDESLVNIPNTNTAAPRNEVVRIIRNDTKDRLENIYKEFGDKYGKDSNANPISG